MDTKNRFFSNADLRRLIIPLIIDQFLQAFVGLADSIMVASVGEAAVSGVSLIDTIMVLILNIFTALATGGAVIAGQFLGKKRGEMVYQIYQSVGFLYVESIFGGYGAVLFWKEFYYACGVRKN